MPYNTKLTPENIEQLVGTEKVEKALTNIDEQLKYDGKVNQSMLARRVGISRTTIIKWLPVLLKLRNIKQ